MSDEFVPYSRSRHPSHHRERVSLGTLFYGMFAAPIVWAGNLMVTYGLIGHACFPGYNPLNGVVPGFGFAWPLVVACYFIGLLVCVSGFAVSLIAWRRTGSESEGHSHRLLRTGEGRSRYFALIGMASSTLFFGAILFGTFVPFVVPLCAH